MKEKAIQPLFLRIMVLKFIFPNQAEICAEVQYLKKLDNHDSRFVVPPGYLGEGRGPHYPQ